MPRTNSSSSSKPISSQPIRLPTVMGPIFPGPPQVVNQQPSFAQNVKDGFSLGVGVSVARNIVDRMFGSAPATQQVPAPLIMKDEKGENKSVS